jgi:hypothetical protein
LVVNAPVDCVPLVTLLPVQPPEAVHAVALAADQLKVDEFPLLTEPGVAERLSVGAPLVPVTEMAAD